MKKINPLIRKTVGKINKYIENKGGCGFVCIGDEKWNDAFLSYREFEKESAGERKMEVGMFVAFDLHDNEIGYFARNAKIISEKEYNAFLMRQ